MKAFPWHPIVCFALMLLVNTLPASGVQQSGRSCSKTEDCGLNSYCRVTDYYGNPRVAFGNCACVEGYVLLTNGSCADGTLLGYAAPSSYVAPSPVPIYIPPAPAPIASVVTCSVVTTTFPTSCTKNADCVPNANCRMFDFYNYPAMWPPCPHVGSCICNEGFIQLSNGSCVPILYRNLYDKCSNQVWERFNSPSQRCNGTIVICNTPSYVDLGGYCAMTPPPTVAAAPVVAVAPVAVVATAPPTVTCQPVGFLSFCDSKQSCCAPGAGLTCQQRGPNSTYSQCLCSSKTSIYDNDLGHCRPRVYGDLCTTSDDCATNLISNTGFECRIGRCRCSVGYEPVDNQFWNETGKSTYMLRICVSSLATTWVPTGQACTMDPHMWAQYNTTRVCHPRAFCHLCYKQRGTGGYSYSSSLTTAVTGMCRELACSGDSDCGHNGRCNNFNMLVDPPCDNGICDCNSQVGFYKDRFSRCAPYAYLTLGQRCIVPDGTTQLHPWYVNQEDWDDDKTCYSIDKLGGYAGYNWGVVKCSLPLIEDMDGFCLHNDNDVGIWYVYLTYGDWCDDQDMRLPLRRCDTSKGLSCIKNRCQCAQSTACASGYGGCSSSATTTGVIWDGAMCRGRGASDACSSSSDCCGGQCLNGRCTCAAGLTLVQFSVGAGIQNGAHKAASAPAVSQYCFKGYSVVQKGGECHLDPISWNCGNQKYGYCQNNLPALVCAPDLICMRCPFDFSTDDEAHGICRSVGQIPDATAPANACTQGGPGGIDVHGPGGWRN